ncbi:hypothetical protein B0H11DRAFT_2416484, partial [Mycena galericulata]
SRQKYRKIVVVLRTQSEGICIVRTPQRSSLRPPRTNLGRRTANASSPASRLARFYATMRLCLLRLPHLPPTLELLLEAHGAAYCPQATWAASLLLLVHAALALLPRTPAPLPRLHDGPLSLAGVHPSPATRSPPMRRSNYGPRAQVGDVAPLFIPAAHPLYSRSGNPVTLQMGARCAAWAYERAEGFARMRKLTDARTLIAASTMAKERQIDGEENGVEGVEDKIVNQDENGWASVKKSVRTCFHPSPPWFNTSAVDLKSRGNPAVRSAPA